MKSFYIAGIYPRREELLERAKQLEALGWKNNTTWVTGHQPGVVDGKEPGEPTVEMKQTWAKQDIKEIAESNVFILCDDALTINRGGMMWEHGYAYANRRLIFVIGYRRNVFSFLPGMFYYRSWESFLGAVERGEYD